MDTGCIPPTVNFFQYTSTSGDFRLEICCSYFVYNLSYGVSFVPCKERKAAICEIFSRFSCFSGLVR
ncbi:hypothetical protein CLI83_07850 [Porphyromonas gingivalis]|nr:hypothetical protein CLI83_07850 [Porphyromonas gingivalis]